jgi:hypothetical protein
LTIEEFAEKYGKQFPHRMQHLKRLWDFSTFLQGEYLASITDEQQRLCVWQSLIELSREAVALERELVAVAELGMAAAWLGIPDREKSQPRSQVLQKKVKDDPIK